LCALLLCAANSEGEEGASPSSTVPFGVAGAAGTGDVTPVTTTEGAAVRAAGRTSTFSLAAIPPLSK